MNKVCMRCKCEYDTRAPSELHHFSRYGHNFSFRPNEKYPFTRLCVDCSEEYLAESFKTLFPDLSIFLPKDENDRSIYRVTDWEKVAKCRLSGDNDDTLSLLLEALHIMTSNPGTNTGYAIVAGRRHEIYTPFYRGGSRRLYFAHLHDGVIYASEQKLFFQERQVVKAW